MGVIVTGANGFIGSAMVWELNRAGLDVLAVTDLVSLEERSDLLEKRRYGRFLNIDELWTYLDTNHAQRDVTWIIHMGANSSTTETDTELLDRLNTGYTKRLFEWAARFGKNLVYASSAATYGSGEKGYDDTTDPELLKPLNLYGESKVLMDRWALQQHKVPTNWYGLKFFNVYGPNENHKASMLSVPFKAYEQILVDGKLKLFKSYRSDYPDGGQKRDFIYVKEVTGWILELIQKKPKSGIYNMGTGQARSWNDLAHAAFKAMNKPAQIEYIDMPEQLQGQYQYFTEARMQKWKAAGMSDSKWPLEKAIKDYYDNHLSKEDSIL